MSGTDVTIERMEELSSRRRERRDLFRSLLAPLAAAGSVGAAINGTAASAQTANPADPSDGDILNFALNLEYLEAQFYSFAVTGTGLPADLLSGSGTRGDVIGGRQVPFQDPLVRDYAREIQQDEVAHVRFLRRALGNAAVAQPTIDVGTAPTGAFSSAARAAGLVGPGQSFDPYANDENFLLGAFIFEDVGVTAYKGAAPLVDNPTFIEAAAGILAVEAYHASLVRTVLYRKGIDTPALIDATEAISDARDSLDGASDLDQGVRPIGDRSNIVPLDADGLVFSRSGGQVLNIVYLNRQAVSQGGFFPNGVNGAIKTSAAN